jgi:mannan endo-1,4-beta-mannosidase
VLSLIFTSKSSYLLFANDNNGAYRDSSTEKLYLSLKKIANSNTFLFGVPNALTISYNGGPKHPYNNQSDCKDITGSHPAFIESDFEWYNHSDFKQWDIQAMKNAYQQGIVLGYCYHLRGPKSGEFYTFNKNRTKTADSTLVKNILASTDRNKNESLNWYLTRLDTLVIPVFKELGFPLIYRPFHEMTGDWFWWGTANCSPDEFVKLYRLTVDYLRMNGIRNALYAWAPDKSTDMRFYPGDDYVDIIGYDGYDVGIASYHSIPFFIDNLKTLSSIATEHNKIFAITEVGVYSLNEYPQFWTKNVFEPIKNNGLLNKIAWIMTWYNADWNHDGTGVSYIPYRGIEKKRNGQLAIDDFLLFYRYPETIFLSDSIPFYSRDNKSFIYPTFLKIKVNEEFTLLGGYNCCWMNQNNYKWKSSDESIATVKSGTVRGIKTGDVIIILNAGNKLLAKCRISVY